jgi:hypothetical protein
VEAGERSVADATISEVAWLAGYWMSDKRNMVTEELWLAPGGGVMLGLHRDVGDENDMTFEYLRIMQTGDGLVYYASPRGYDTTKFLLTSLSDEGDTKQVVFENPEHDFPNLIRYTLTGDELRAEVRGSEDDIPIVKVWSWRRAELPRNPIR